MKLSFFADIKPVRRPNCSIASRILALQPDADGFRREIPASLEFLLGRKPPLSFRATTLSSVASDHSAAATGSRNFAL
jgi:hypothetical protein